jgi:hypothetical protein
MTTSIYGWSPTISREATHRFRTSNNAKSNPEIKGRNSIFFRHGCNCSTYLKSLFLAPFFFTTFHQQRYTEFQRWFQANDIINTRIHATVTLGTDHLTWRRGVGYGFLLRSEFFFRTKQELEYLFFLSREAQIYFPEFNIRLYYKNSNQIVFFYSTIIRIFLFSNIGKKT